MALKFTIYLPVFFLALLAPSSGEGQSRQDQSHGQYQCERLHQPTNCRNDSTLRVYKTEDYYQLWLCLNNECTWFNSDVLRIKCIKVCNFCQSLLGSNECGTTTNQSYCEEQVDTFLDGYCASTHTTSSSVPTVGVTHTQLTHTVTATRTIVVTVTVPSYRVLNGATKSRNSITKSVLSPSCSQPNTVVVPSISLKEQSLSRSEVNTAPAAVLGALFGVSLLLLAMLITGWVCTCFIHKKDSWQAKEIPHYRTELLDASYEDELIENPAYEATILRKREGEITQQGPHDAIRYNRFS